MKTSRWLLPFTFGVNMAALDSVVRLAASAGATLVPVSLICAPHKGARLEHIQQSKDFLEAVQNKAALYHVPVECYEVFTVDVFQSLRMLVHDMHCGGIVLVTGGVHPHLLRDEEVERLLVEPPAALVLIRLPTHSRLMSAPHPRARFRSWLHSCWGPQDSAGQEQDAPVVEEPLWIRTEQRHLG
ncbi:MAG TPA: hypothetical protein VHZ51_24960 [Ktedonobacteraceae bacterium]|nr:hypothetical protein [Ktedonobacteraceae bacterium]